MRPSEKDYAPYYKSYIEKIKGDDIINIFQEQLNTASEFFQLIPEEKGNYTYAEGKWCIKEVLGHLVDTERIFAYRALCIAREVLEESMAAPDFRHILLPFSYLNQSKSYQS